METGALEEVIKRVAVEIAVAYDAGVVEVARVKGDVAKTLAQIGFDDDLSTRFVVPGPLARMVIARREAVVLRDPGIEKLEILTRAGQSRCDQHIGAIDGARCQQLDEG